MKNKPIPKGEVIEGDISKSLDSRFLNSIVLQGAMEERGVDALEVEIDRVEYHAALKYQNGTIDKDAYLLYFKGSARPLKLAKTNLKRLITMHGVIGKAWNGKKIKLHIEQDRRPDLGGIRGDCVRVVWEQPKPDRKATSAGLANLIGEEGAE